MRSPFVSLWVALARLLHLSYIIFLLLSLLLLVRCLLAVISTAPGLLTEPEENMSIVAGLESDNIASVNRKEGKWGMLKEVADLHKSGEQ